MGLLPKMLQDVTERSSRDDSESETVEEKQLNYFIGQPNIQGRPLTQRRIYDI